MSLANETLFFIADLLGENDLWALCLVNRRLNSVAAPILWKRLYDSSSRSKAVLLWAVEAGRSELLKALLERKVSPDFLYLSSLLRSRLRDVLGAQGRHCAVGPRNDETLQAEIFREKYCRSAIIRKKVRYMRFLHGVGLAMTEDDEWNLDNGGNYQHTCSLERFGVAENLGDPEDRQYWAWGPIHIAILRGDNTALRLLLDHGADIDARCSGACDCAVPELSGEDDLSGSVAPHQNRSMWTPLHVAMCSGNAEAVRLLISRGASVFVGGLIRQPYGLDRFPRLGMTALQDAAWMGSVQMLSILLESPRFQSYIDHGNRQQQTPLHYAAAGGHIRTVGKHLLKEGATFHFYEGETPRVGPAVPKIRNDPLRLLCMQFRFDDARWLVDFCKRLYRGKGFDPKPLYTRALATLCSLREPAVCVRRSLREQQDRLYSLTSDDLNKSNEEKADREAAEASQPGRLAFAGKLLVFGADINEPQRASYLAMPFLETGYSQYGICHRTPLQLAAACGFTSMVNLLISRGVDCNKIDRTHEPGPEHPRLLPLMLALKNALDTDNGLQTVEALLKAGASLDDVGNQSVLRAFQQWELDFHGKPQRNHGTWLRIAEVLLRSGAATRTSQSNWAAVVQTACRPGNLAFCKSLEAARPFDGFLPGTLTKMVWGVAFSRPGLRHGVPEDIRLLKWVLRHCLTPKGGLKISSWKLQEYAELAQHLKLTGVSVALQDFADEHEDAEVSSSSKPAVTA